MFTFVSKIGVEKQNTYTYTERAVLAVASHYARVPDRGREGGKEWGRQIGGNRGAE